MMRRIPIYLRFDVAPHFNAALNVSAEVIVAIWFRVFAVLAGHRQQLIDQRGSQARQRAEYGPDEHR